MTPHAERQLFTLGSRASITAAAIGLAFAYGAGIGGVFGWIPNFEVVRYSLLSGGGVALFGGAAYLAMELRKRRQRSAR